MEKKTETKINPNVIYNLLNMSYFMYVSYLRKKYGGIKESYASISNFGDIIINENINKENEGLYIHHVHEYYIPNLNSKSNINLYPQYQEGKSLVYCNLLEYLLLFIKIKNETSTKVDKMYKIIIPKLNDIYSGINYTNNKDKEIALLVKDKKELYLSCLLSLNIRKKGDCDKILTSSRSNRKYGWSIKNNEEFFNEIKRYLKYDKMKGFSNQEKMPDGPLNFLEKIKKAKESEETLEKNFKFLDVRKLVGIALGIFIAILIIIVIAIVATKKV
ncbi:Hypothetical protein, predicted transmembrane protein [Metamycoplasma auris 15026]|uniref:Uncharacterized protein n=1 Tax=Metamycoplasma auris 15026 TaxID=1188233 RepID=N9UZ77_9BACT|nr:hypothetical protein [Metamycoplasma auris]ENY68497.1 Hypothetical protein, predicted transmembrane protein [Metamycoplasma auris 15026]